MISTEQERLNIKYLVVQGDSLTDPGKMAQHRWLACLSGLSGTSPDGRFTNGFVWFDYFGTALRTGVRPAQFTDDHFRQMKTSLVDPDRVVTSGARDCIRTYCEGGMTAHDYSNRLTPNLVHVATEMVVTTLTGKRQHLLRDDHATEMRPEQRELTLVFEWSGANDLITLNDTPTDEAANLAVHARLENLRQLIGEGYRHFVLFNLPDLSLTPRFQHRDVLVQANVKRVIEEFNQALNAGIIALRRIHQHCNIDCFDANKIFTNAFHNPESYGITREKRSLTYKSSPQYKPNTPSSAEGYMFWDDVHPTTRVHQALAEDFLTWFENRYRFENPVESLVENFRDEYGRSLVEEEMGTGCASLAFFKTQSFAYKTSELPEVLEQGIYKSDPRTRDILIRLGWIDSQGQIISQHPDIIEAARQLSESRSRRPEASRFSGWCSVQ